MQSKTLELIKYELFKQGYKWGAFNCYLEKCNNKSESELIEMLNNLRKGDVKMKKEIQWTLNNGNVKSIITGDEATFKIVNGLYQIGYRKEGKTKFTWIPYKAKTYSHNVIEIVEYELGTGRRLNTYKCEQ